MKKIALLSFLFLCLISCKSTSSGIITSKEEAIEQGVYKTPNAKKSLAKTTSTKKTLAEKKKNEAKLKRKEPKVATVKVADDEIDFTSKLIATAMKYSGVRYQYGGSTFAGMDCSGLVCTVYRAHDVSLPRTSNAQAKAGKKIKRKRVQKGDLVFFKTSRRNVINHVGIVTEVADGTVYFIHASTSSGVVVSSLDEAYYQKAFAQFNRVLDADYF